MQEYFLKGRIETNKNGYQTLVNFYNSIKFYQNQTIKLNTDSLNWIDANLSAIWLAMITRLKKTNNLKFYIDFQSLKGDLGILLRNGFAYAVVGKSKEYKLDDYRKSTVPIKAFMINNDKGIESFVNYIEKELLNHRGLDNINFKDKDRVKNSYFEIFDNVGLHAETKWPIITCGQYFPKQKILKFTLVDFGVGFLKKILKHTKGEVSKPHEAIKWAIDGNSTKKDAKGGTGLNKIFFYCTKNNGSIQIITDGCYWDYSEKSINNYKIDKPFIGTTINLFFRYL